jgi:hypothetical protein
VVAAHVSVERRLRVFGFRPWIGLRARNLFNRAAPSDVQNHVTSPRFGEFFDSAPREFRINLRVR